MKSINLNDFVYVVLNDIGVNIMREAHESLKKEFPSLHDFVPPSTEKPTQFQLWNLMQTFGPSLYPGAPIPFQTATINFEGEFV